MNEFYINMARNIGINSNMLVNEDHRSVEKIKESFNFQPLLKGLGGLKKAELGILSQYWRDAQHPVPRLWIRSAEVGGGGGRRGRERERASLGEWEHNNNLS